MRSVAFQRLLQVLNRSSAQGLNAPLLTNYSHMLQCLQLSPADQRLLVSRLLCSLDSHHHMCGCSLSCWA